MFPKFIQVSLYLDGGGPYIWGELYSGCLFNVILQKSISIKNNLLKKYITTKDPQVKERYHKEYKDYRNMLSTILKQSKTNYYNHTTKTTTTNRNSIKNTWKGLKSILNIKDISADIPKTFTVDGTTIFNPMEIFSTTIFLEFLLK